MLAATSRDTSATTSRATSAATLADTTNMLFMMKIRLHTWRKRIVIERNVFYDHGYFVIEQMHLYDENKCFVMLSQMLRDFDDEMNFCHNFVIKSNIWQIWPLQWWNQLIMDVHIPTSGYFYE